jgi:transcriptional regulator with XRE-family HTH domain
VAKRKRPRADELRPAVEILAGRSGRAACIHRDVAAVYRLLSKAGYSQRRLRAMTGQSQSEVSEILAGRQVTSVLVLERIADGLGCPRAWWRLTGANEYGDVQRLSTVVAAARVSLDERRAEQVLYLDAVEQLQQTATDLATQLDKLRTLLTSDESAPGAHAAP